MIPYVKLASHSVGLVVERGWVALGLLTNCQPGAVSEYFGSSRVTGLSREVGGTASVALLLMDVRF